MTRRQALVTIGAAFSPALTLAQTKGKRPAAAPAKTPVLVYKDANCGCCHKWVEYMQANGFDVTVKDTADLNAIKRARGIAEKLWSCHTAHIGGYLIEGHVPVDDIRKLIAETPKGVLGLAIPGMPQSAPGMDLKPFQPYTVYTFDAAGRTTVYTVHKTA